MEKLHYSDISNITHYDLEVFCKEKNLFEKDKDFLIELLLQEMWNCKDFWYEEFKENHDIELGNQYDKGFEEGKEDAETNFKSVEDSINDGEVIEIEKHNKQKTEAFNEGFVKGYLEGEQWITPSILQEEIKSSRDF